MHKMSQKYAQNVIYPKPAIVKVFALFPPSCLLSLNPTLKGWGLFETLEKF